MLNSEELKEIGFKWTKRQSERKVGNVWIQNYHGCKHITLAQKNVFDGYSHIELKNVNTIEKVKKLIELLK